ncbi:MAG TPA: XdhC family protein [Terracidiphilus sp.]|nr:XdhC family protein [Terracidiphilus sp.]
MTDLESILPLWRELESRGSDFVLATIVAVEGSSYRKPGTHMLLTQDGRRAGTVSGGCLEAEVARRAWWLTASGPVIETYSTGDDDGDRPFGSGCGGVVHLLLERKHTAGPLLQAVDEAFRVRSGLAVATVLEGPRIGQRAFAGLAAGDPQISLPPGSDNDFELLNLAAAALVNRGSFESKFPLAGVASRVWGHYYRARTGLWICSAGDDAKPLVHLAHELGWFVAVADGRSNLATQARFPNADEVCVLPITDLPGAAHAHLHLLPSDAAVVMTHSFEQDSRVLASLLALESPLAYLGVLGPQRRTRELLIEAAHLLGLPATDDRVDLWLAEMHAPTGLDLGAETPASIALSIMAEIQQTLSSASALPLRRIRATDQTVACS